MCFSTKPQLANKSVTGRVKQQLGLEALASEISEYITYHQPLAFWFVGGKRENPSMHKENMKTTQRKALT